MKKVRRGGGHFRKKCNVISNKLEILEDALFESSNTSTHKMKKLDKMDKTLKIVENSKKNDFAYLLPIYCLFTAFK